MFGLMRFDVCFSTYLRRYLRNTLRMWQVQYVTDFGYSIGELALLVYICSFWSSPQIGDDLYQLFGDVRTSPL
jgi:hypothetical protein